MFLPAFAYYEFNAWFVPNCQSAMQRPFSSGRLVKVEETCGSGFPPGLSSNCTSGEEGDFHPFFLFNETPRGRNLTTEFSPSTPSLFGVPLPKKYLSR